MFNFRKGRTFAVVDWSNVQLAKKKECERQDTESDIMWV